MGQVSEFLRRAEGDSLTYWCQGCKEPHAVNVGPGGWDFNGDLNKPTFTPSVLVRGLQLNRNEDGEWIGEGLDAWVRDDAGNAIRTVCHTFITDGMVQFLGDCTHALAGQTLPLPPLPSHMRDERGST